MRDNVARVRQLLSEAVARKHAEIEQNSETRMRRAFQLYEADSTAPIVIDQSPRARALRQIRRISTWYGWQHEIEAALDAAAATSVEALEDSDIAALVERLKKLEDCTQFALGSPDAPPAQ